LQLDLALAKVRELTADYKSGKVESFDAFRDLAQLLLGETVLADEGAVRLVRGPRGESGVLSGRTGSSPLPLRDGRFLRLAIKLFRAQHDDGSHRIKVEATSYQYQADPDGDRWIFRYDYIREPGNEHPASHLQIRGNLHEPDALPAAATLERVHFPTRRISLEAVIRLLAQDFNVPCSRDGEYWRPLLMESAAAFHEIAHDTI
jgi:hypothetical protein